MDQIQGECPHCKGENVDYGVIEIGSPGAYYPAKCEDCKTTWEEWYNLEFVEHRNIKTPSKLEKSLVRVHGKQVENTECRTQSLRINDIKVPGTYENNENYISIVHISEHTVPCNDTTKGPTCTPFTTKSTLEALLIREWLTDNYGGNSIEITNGWSDIINSWTRYKIFK